MAQKKGQRKVTGKPFVKGDKRICANPPRPGRPPAVDSIATMLREVLVCTPAENADKCAATAAAFRSHGRTDATCAQILACQLVATAMNDPESKSMSHVLDRTWGKVAQPIDVTGVAVTDVLREYGIEDVVAEINRRAREVQ